MRTPLAACLALCLLLPLSLNRSAAQEAAPDAQPAGASAEAARVMVTAAKALLASLEPAQTKRACFPFDSPERENWAFVPKERAGVPLAALQASQQKFVRELLASALSQKGLLKADTIMALESLLAEIENDPARRDPAKYHLILFGEPAADQPWGWRFEGHHLSVNLTLVPGKPIAATPSFMGANPAEVRAGPRKGTRPLAAEEDLARSLATALAGSGQQVLFSDKAPAEILTAADRQARQLDPVGVTAAAMGAEQKKALRALVAEYARRHRPAIAEADLARIDKDFDSLRFGWAGSLKPGEAYYYRVQGPALLIEAANTQNHANHIHTVWRDLKNDFGRDSLAEHFHDHPH